MTNNVKYIQADDLRNYCIKLFESVGVPKEEAFINADNLVDANLSGIDSHGVSRMGIYLKRIRENVVKPQSRVTIMNEAPATVSLNGENSMGAVVSKKAMELAIAKAKETGVSYVTVNNSNHFGTAAYFTKMALNHNMIGFAATNGASRMAPWGGKEAYFGTNPFSVSIPAGSERPIIVDMATSVVARGKIIMAQKNSETIPEGWAMNKDGEFTTSAQEALDGTVLPFGGPKGSAIALIIDVLSGVLAGAAFGTGIKDMYGNFKEPTNTGHVFGVLNIEKFIAVDLFKSNMDQMIKDIKANSPAQGVQEVFLPGEIELRKAEQRLKEGIPITLPVLRELEEEGRLCGVTFQL
ncbi:Ldh family oxidoreductase [Anaerobacillus isosaccharinicus]|uniref:Ldh family oxidoreductase n=1 Tax=Anaerobacillus isosaccharinicus TaxID=1532552 RepID=A0A1S2KUG4_9BACI|nr:Ldh family oxidoreductase [Anaerobacillus isosaccharinicus]MBA5588303.1 Ldh family oxidoreductase [Anaerobacillus isosaccharinicus]QOY38260.1 Ldh family oxidoreductase [Anaerobacillus isosaccharinicus]